MKNQILTVATALTFVACEENLPPTAVAPKPLIVSKVVQRTPISGLDAGVTFAKVEDSQLTVDALALPHDANSVDHLARARQLMESQDVAGALTEARRALFTSPSDVESLDLIGKLGRMAGQPSLSAVAFGRLAAQRPSDAVVCIKQARAFLQAKDFAGAIAAGREASTRDPGNPEAFQATGIAQLSSGALNSAIISFRTVVALQPDHGYAMNNLGLAYLRANRNDEAVEILEEALEQLPTVSYVHNNLGVAYERVGRADDAKHAFQKAMDLSPKYVKARLNAARVAKSPVTEDTSEDETMSDMPHPLPEGGFAP
jgi:tetratricopeptide (TPR) repeat protein